MENKIEKSLYEGYLWYSDQKEPFVLMGEEYEGILVDGENPFVIEGQLYDGTHSISIRYVDGHYYIQDRVDVKSKDLSSQEQLYFPSFGRDKIEALRFKQLWKEEPDLLCENMAVLKPAGAMFLGFKRKENEL